MSEISPSNHEPADADVAERYRKAETAAHDLFDQSSLPRKLFIAAYVGLADVPEVGTWALEFQQRLEDRAKEHPLCERTVRAEAGGVLHRALRAQEEDDAHRSHLHRLIWGHVSNTLKLPIPPQDREYIISRTVERLHENVDSYKNAAEGDYYGGQQPRGLFSITKRYGKWVTVWAENVAKKHVPTAEEDPPNGPTQGPNAYNPFGIDVESALREAQRRLSTERCVSPELQVWAKGREGYPRVRAAALRCLVELARAFREAQAHSDPEALAVERLVARALHDEFPESEQKSATRLEPALAYAVAESLRPRCCLYDMLNDGQRPEVTAVGAWHARWRMAQLRLLPPKLNELLYGGERRMKAIGSLGRAILRNSVDLLDHPDLAARQMARTAICGTRQDLQPVYEKALERRKAFAGKPRVLAEVVIDFGDDLDYVYELVREEAP